MGKSAAARKLAAAAAYGGGGLSALGAALFGVLAAEAKVARRTIGEASLEPPDSTGWYARHLPGPAVKIALLGDSSAAGYGVARVQETPGAMLASAVARHANRRVFLREFCVVGAESSGLHTQVTGALEEHPDVAVVLVGVNDVTHTVPPNRSVRQLAESVRRLQEGGTDVVVGTCPDLGTLRPVWQPLRQVARLWSRRLAAAQAIATVEAGGRAVSLGDILGPEFEAAPTRFFGPDRFHPSVDGYRQLAGVLVPSVLAALDLLPEEELPTEAFRGETVLPISTAAVEAAQTAGTELDGTEVAGARRGVRGRWVELRHRRRDPGGEVEPPQEDEPEEVAATESGEDGS